MREEYTKLKRLRGRYNREASWVKLEREEGREIKVEFRTVKNERGKATVSSWGDKYFSFTWQRWQ